ncbi:MAG: hypothetical protein U1G07_16850 [Verrucomicrobiota bacterium]
MSGDRESDYIGATASYSFGQKWYFDFSYARGNSSTSADVPAGATLIPSDFKIDDDWYQFYVRYAFPALRGKKLAAYLRAGISFVQTDLRADGATTIGDIPVSYSQKDDATDILGNVGFGLTYTLYNGERARFGVQFEGEGFYGNRSQETVESLQGITFPKHDIDNSVFGGVGRLTGRFEYALGKRGLVNLFADAGLQAKYSLINYDELHKDFDELLWGPYVKIGVSVSF